MKILVTGDSGLIGSHLVEKFYEEGHEVFGISRTSRNVHIYKTTHLNINLQDSNIVDTAIDTIKPDIVFHAAANVAEGKSQTFPVDITQNNIGIFMNVLTSSIRAGAKRFVYFSSNAVYGELPTPYVETQKPKPQDIYAINKLAAEEALKVLAKAYNIEYVILRPHNVYGPRQYMKDRYKNVVMLFMNQLLRDEPYKLFGNGELKRNFSYVDDVVQAAAYLGLNGPSGEIYNIGSEKAHSIRELSNTILKAAKSKIVPELVIGRKTDVHDAIPNHDKLNKIFPYHETSLEEGIRKTWKWAKEQGPQEYDVEVPEL
jgi:UDP-glucose 4-epimerase